MKKSQKIKKTLSFSKLKKYKKSTLVFPKQKMEKNHKKIYKIFLKKT